MNVVWLGCLLVSAAAPLHDLAAQEPTPPRQLALDASILAGGLSYAHITSSGNFVGVGAGAGTELSIRMVSGENWGEMSVELLHVDLFSRRRTSERWQYDLGLRAAVDMHSQSVHGQSGSEQEIGGFLGGYFAPMWGSPRFQMGPRIQAGAYWAPHASFGLGITPLTARYVVNF